MGVARTDRHFDYLGPRRAVRTESRRPTFLKDPPWVIFKRKRFARKLRAVLYGFHSSHTLPFWGDKGRREMTWAFQVRELEKMFFRYIEQMHEALAFVRENGPAEFPVGDVQECLDRDLDLLKRYQRWMYRRERELRPGDRRKNVPKAFIVAWNSKKRTEAMVMQQICPLCGDGLPCKPCGVPLFEPDGAGGLRPKEGR